MIGIGEVFTTRIQKPHFCGLGVYDPNKVFTDYDENGKVKVDGVLSKIVKEPVDQNYVIIAGKKYKTVTFGDKIWMAEPLQIEFEGTVKNTDETFGVYYTASDIEKIMEMVPEGWRLPNFGGSTDFAGIYGAGAYALQSTEYESIWPNATNETGFDARPSGIYSITTSTFPAIQMTKNVLLTSNLTTCVIIETTKVTSYNFGSGAANYRFPIRLMKDAV